MYYTRQSVTVHDRLASFEVPRRKDDKIVIEKTWQSSIVRGVAQNLLIQYRRRTVVVFFCWTSSSAIDVRKAGFPRTQRLA
jgi:hypothetical protein